MLPLAAAWQDSGLPRGVETAIRAIARWSYSLYLCQLAVFRSLSWAFGWNATTPLACLLEAVIFAILSIVAAALVYCLFERPILLWRDRVA